MPIFWRNLRKNAYAESVALAKSPHDSGLAVVGWWEGDEFTEGTGGGAIFTPPGGGGRTPPDDGLAFGLLVTSLPSFFC